MTPPTRMQVWAKRELLSREAASFLSGMLTRDVNQRLGCGPGGLANIREHEWFESHQIDWERLEAGALPAPFVPRREVNAKDEAKMKTFNTAGMKRLQKEDQERWSGWDWTSADYFRAEISGYLYEQWGLHDARKGRLGGGGGGGCCEIS